MKYLEELSGGDCFEYNKHQFIVSQDFKPNGYRLCLGLKNGFPKWLDPSLMVNQIDLFTIDKDNNIVAIKERKADNANNVEN